MSTTILLSFVIGYFLLLLGVAWYTSRGSNNESFFIGNRKSNWMLVAFGMIGTSLSGVTFVSVPGAVGESHFTYFQVVFGYLLGYIVIAYVLLPLYYRMNLTSIYAYLGNRFGKTAHLTGSTYFIISRVIGATARLYLVINVLQLFILDQLHLPFVVTSLIILTLIMLYTFQGGVKTIVYTDTLQTLGMLVGLVACIMAITSQLHLGFGDALQQMNVKGYTQILNTDPKSGTFFIKQIIGGMFITIVMTGLDQEMMQKNISVKNLKDSQKNIMSFAAVLVLVNFLFLFLGGLLHLYQSAHPEVNAAKDALFPAIALHGQLGGAIGIIFIIALISALFPSVDGAITSLTSSFCIDILGMHQSNASEQEKKRKRMMVHFSFAALFFLLLIIFKIINNGMIIDFILKFAGITYGPLLGMFAFGILTKREIQNKLLWIVCLAGPLFTLVIDVLCNPSWYEKLLHTKIGLNDISSMLFGGYKIGVELILINGLIVFAGLLMISRKNKS